MIFFNLLKIVSALVVKAELSAIALVRPVVISIYSKTLSTGLIHFKSFAETANASIKVFSVDKTQAQHVVASDKVLVKLGDFFGRKFGKFEKRLGITFD